MFFLWSLDYSPVFCGRLRLYLFDLLASWMIVWMFWIGVKAIDAFCRGLYPEAPRTNLHSMASVCSCSLLTIGYVQVLPFPQL